MNPQTTRHRTGAGPRSGRSPRQSDDRSSRSRRSASPGWITCALLALGLVLAGAAPAGAQGKRERTAQRKETRPAAGKKAGGAKAKKKEKVFDFTGFELAGSVRMPQLLYFLDRAEEELERASLERRTFVPEMLKTLDEENL